MRSTFMGLETSKRGLFTQQSALYTTGHNISNANTIGYSRQRVNMETTQGFPGPGLNSPTTAGHIGTGVQAHSVQRIRDEFVDRQYRQETNKLGYWQSTTKSISQMEDIMSEPSKFGITQAFSDFWKSMEDVVDDPKDTAARQVMLSRGQTLAESFNYMDINLKQIQGNIGNEIKVITGEVNNLLKQIADLNRQIQVIEPNGYMPNDLYDARDVLVDQLNDIIPVSISFEKSGGNALEIAEGSMTISYKPYGSTDKIILVQGKEHAKLSTVTAANGEVDGEVDTPASGEYAPFSKIEITNAFEPNQAFDNTKPPSPTNPLYVAYGGNGEVEIEYTDFDPGKGKLVALIDAYGYIDNNGNTAGIYPEMLAKIDRLAAEFITEFNDIHRQGFTLGDPNATPPVTSITGVEFFSGTNAREFSMILTDPKSIAVSDTANEEGNNINMLKLSALQSAVQGNLQGGTFQSFYQSLIGELGVKGRQAVTLEVNSATILQQIENRRASHNSVSLDEEMTNMISFQQAYNASARMITVIDETLDKIINGMGRVGL